MANANDKAPRILGAPAPKSPKHQTRPNDRADAYTFPTPTKSGAGVQFRTLGGLTKREHFAGLALGGLLASDGDADLTVQTAAEIAVSQADALIAALNESADDEAEAQA